MRIILYKDGSVISDAVAMNLVHGANVIEFDVLGYIDNTLRVDSAYQESYQNLGNGRIQLIITVPVEAAVIGPMEVPVAYATRDINGAVLIYPDTGRKVLYVNSMYNHSATAEIGIGVGEIELATTDRVAEYVLLPFTGSEQLLIKPGRQIFDVDPNVASVVQSAPNQYYVNSTVPGFLIFGQELIPFTLGENTILNSI